jgi:predicted RNA-binding protein with TRAM domain
MVEIPDSLRSVFSATVRERDDAYVIEVPSGEIDHDAVIPGGTYRVAMLDSTPTGRRFEGTSRRPERERGDRQRGRPEPPVDEGEVREVTIETIGDQGDGIAKVERGYVVIVPGAEEGDKVTIKITKITDNFAIGEVIKEDTSP